MIKIETKKQIVYESFDYTNPIGNVADNHTNAGLIEEIEKYFNKTEGLHILDIGCAGGQFIVDCFTKGHSAYGIDGVDHVLTNEAAAGHHNWKSYYNKNFFLADAGEPYTISDEEVIVKFDCISTWENIEHIFPNNLNNYFTNVSNHLSDAGIFIGSISTHEHDHHPSAFPYEFWEDKFKENGLTFEPYCFNNKLRECGGSLYFTSKKIK
jgi:cyclopropane fatty-acyl-phospholipid synthase-like methyltransferase